MDDIISIDSYDIVEMSPDESSCDSEHDYDQTDNEVKLCFIAFLACVGLTAGLVINEGLKLI